MSCYNMGKILSEHGVDTEIFMAPGHSYDRNTLVALRDVGFTTVTDGRSRRPYYLDGIRCIPAKSAYRLHTSGLLTICVHCCAESEADFLKLKAFLEARRQDVISFEEACKIKRYPYWIARIEEVVSIGSERFLSLLIKLVKH